MNTDQRHDAMWSLCSDKRWVLRGDELEWQETESNPPTEEELQAEVNRLEAARPMKKLRHKRDMLLLETDVWAFSDRTMTAEQIAYRQALRDLPDNTTDPANPVWPTKP